MSIARDVRSIAFEETKGATMATKKDKETTLAIPFNKVLGYTCPQCLSVGVGAKWADGTNYCPKCGQKIKLVNVDVGEWAMLLKDVQEIPNVEKTNIVTTQPDYTQGLSRPKRTINGVYLERMRKALAESEQIKGQLSLF